MWRRVFLLFLAIEKLSLCVYGAEDCLSLGFNADILICNVCETLQKITGDNELYVRLTHINSVCANF